MKKFLLALLFVFLAGCISTPVRPRNEVPQTPAETALLSQVLASVDQANADLGLAPASPYVNAARYNLRVAKAGLPTPASPKHQAEAKARSDAAIAGDDKKAERLTGDAEGQLVKDVIAARQERDQAITALQTERAAMEAKLTAAKKEAAGSVWKTVQFWGVALLYAAAVVSLILAVLRVKTAVTTGLDIIAGLKSSAFLLMLASVCFTVARFISSDYFWWGCGGVIVLGGAYVAFLSYSEAHADAAKRVLTPIRRALDKAYDSAAPEVQKDLQAQIFDPIATEMKAVKAPRRFLHLDRALDKGASTNASATS